MENGGEERLCIYSFVVRSPILHLMCLARWWMYISVSEVMKAVEIDSAFNASETEYVLANGFKIGDKVKLMKRITVEYTLASGKKYRKDVSAGAELFIVNAKTNKSGIWPVLEFEAEAEDGEQVSVQKEIAPDKISKISAEAAEPEEEKPEKTYKVKGLEFLGKIPQGQKAKSHKKWHNHLPNQDEDALLSRVKDRVNFALWSVLESLPKYTDADLHVVEITDEGGNSTLQVWTARRFEAFGLMLGPDANHVLDRMYTQGKSSVIRGGDRLHPKQKPLVIDGRMRTKITALRSMSLFFIVQRAEKDADSGKSNLDVKHATSTISIDIELPGKNKRKMTCMEGGDLDDDSYQSVGIPVMFNPKAIPANTRLVANYDDELSKLLEKEKNQNRAEAKKAARAELAKKQKKEKEEKDD